MSCGFIPDTHSDLHKEASELWDISTPHSTISTYLDRVGRKQGDRVVWREPGRTLDTQNASDNTLSILPTV